VFSADSRAAWSIPAQGDILAGARQSTSYGMNRPPERFRMPPTFRASAERATMAHVLRRVGFGASREDVDVGLARGLETTVADLLARRAHPEELTRGIDALLSLQDLTKLQAPGMALILGNAAPLLERTTLMWHGHFATSDTKLGDARLMQRQNQLFRELGLGDFRALLHAVARDPAMLLWLDGDQNKVGRPNENFAREVMELFTLGVDAGYSERDVAEAARAFSGAGVDRREFVFRPREHDAGEKVLFGRGGVFTGEDTLERLLAHPACPRWVARRLLTTFCVPEPARELCEAWGRALVAHDWRIDRTLAELFQSELFLGPTSRRSRIAGPVELVANVSITLRTSVSPSAAMRAAGDMGQLLFVPPTVKGWDGGRAWIHPGTWLARHNFLMELVLDSDTFDARRAYGDDVAQADIVARVIDTLLPDGVDAGFGAALENAARRVSETSNASNDSEAARDVTALVLTAPEFQLT
jgi:uncharacterized protein (DUF1800 family)